VRGALQWLKANNRYYADIDINTERLTELPEDDVPEEILSVVRQSTDIGLVDQESAGYVPQHDGEAGVNTNVDEVDDSQ
jgi:hypothetical protein